MMRCQDVAELPAGARLQLQRELDRVYVHFLKLIEVAAFFQLPVWCIKVTLDFNLDANITGVLDLYLECPNLVPA